MVRPITVSMAHYHDLLCAKNGIWLGNFENGLSKSIFISDNNSFLGSMFSVNDEQDAHVNVARASDDVFS